MLKKVLIFASLLYLTHFCYSLSVDLGELQGNPYFKDDLTTKLEEAEKQEEAEKAEAEQKFLQEGLEEAARKEAEAAQEEVKPPPFVPTEGNENIHDEEDYHGFNVDDVESLANPEELKDNQEEEPDTTIKDKNIDLSIGYNPLFILPVGNKELENLLGPENISSCNFAGLAFRADWMFFPYFLGLNGLGFKQTWNLFYKEGANYQLFANFLTTDIYFTHKMQIASTHHIFEFYAGAGLITFVKPEFIFKMDKYKDNNTKEIETYKYKEQSEINYCYPSVIAGAAVQFYIKRNFYIDADIDFSWPFLTDDPFPFIEATVSAGWHF